uniref:Peptidase S54 rhomboid domain-containing protein n=1 Tax=Anabas testudineus TaxID=64144 RepID=A0A7N6AFM5_ANATE
MCVSAELSISLAFLEICSEEVFHNKPVLWLVSLAQTTFVSSQAIFSMWNRRRGSQLGLLLLASQVFQVGLDNIPPVTLGVLALNVYLYMFPVAPPMQTCVSVQQACWLKDWRRLLLSPVHHVDDLHLYFNMVSFIWKGIRLERRLGGSWFLYLLSVFSLLSGLVYLVLEALLTELTQDQSYSMSCAVGFSDVLFALKVLNNHYHPGGVTYMLGVPVSNRYASWVELVLIHILSPGTSFVGHLSGILVGLLYTAGPLETIMKKCSELMTSKGYNPQRRQYFRSSGYSGHHQQAPDYTTNNTSYSGGLTEEEQLETAIRNSLYDRGSADVTEDGRSKGSNCPGLETFQRRSVEGQQGDVGEAKNCKEEKKNREER